MMIKKVKTKGWKKIALEYGTNELEVPVPPDCVMLSMKDVPILTDPGRAVEKALSYPAASPTLEEILKRKRKAAAELRVSITVSDITRPVPYQGAKGILGPLLKKLEDAGIRKRNIKFIIGTGTHRSSTTEEKRTILGERIVGDYPILDHNCEDSCSLTYLGKTRRNTDVYVNTEFFSADVRIVTGLVESHFMAGFSGGRKGVCPALVDKRTIEKFHGPEFLESPCADNLILAGNPCHEEALDVARTVGVDFLVNVTLDKNMQLTGVFAGDLVESHHQACRFLESYAAIPLNRDFDIVLTHGGYVGRSHYQAAKAACAALPAVKENGQIILAADNHDQEPIGSPEYVKLIRSLKKLGPEGFVNMLRDPAWTFTKDQWQPQVWARVIRKIGEQGLFYCAPRIPPEDMNSLPGRSGFDFLDEDEGMTDRDAAQEMVRNAVLFVVSEYLDKGESPSMCVLREGPYGIPLPSETP